MGTRVRGVAIVVLVLVTGAVLGSWFAEWLRAPATAGTPVRITVPTVFGERVRVEVLNGGGRSGMAKAATDALRDRGFDVVDVGNWSTFDEPTSFVVNRMPGLEDARRVADLLGIGEVRGDTTENLYVDVTVVLGQEWEPSLLDAVPDPTGDRVPWWDLRQYLERPNAPSPGTRLVDPETDTGRP
jgi:hypothetical protein